MSKIIIFMLLATVIAEEESPITISKSADKEGRIAIYENSKHGEDFRTINVGILNEKAQNNDKRIRISDVARDTTHRRSTNVNSQSFSTNMKHSDDALHQEKLVSKKSDIEFQERSGTATRNDNTIRDGHVELAMEMKPNDTENKNFERIPRLIEDVESISEAFINADIQSMEDAQRPVVRDIILDTKVRAGNSFKHWEKVKAILPSSVPAFYGHD